MKRLASCLKVFLAAAVLALAAGLTMCAAGCDDDHGSHWNHGHNEFNHHGGHH